MGTVLLLRSALTHWTIAVNAGWKAVEQRGTERKAARTQRAQGWLQWQASLLQATPPAEAAPSTAGGQQEDRQEEEASLGAGPSAAGSQAEARQEMQAAVREVLRVDGIRQLLSGEMDLDAYSREEGFEQEDEEDWEGE